MKKIFYLLFVLKSLCLFGCKNKEVIQDSDKQSLEIVGYFPNSGNSGTLVTIEGENFNHFSDLSVLFGEQNGKIVSVGRRQILVEVPKGGGTVDVFLINKQDKLAIGKYTYQKLSLHSIAPDFASLDMQIAIRGEGLIMGANLPKVFLNNYEVKIVSISDTILYVTVPKGQGIGPVKIVQDEVEATGPNFQFISFLDMQPRSGGKGTVVEIKVDGLDRVKNSIIPFFNNEKVNYAPGKILKITDSLISVEVPEFVMTGGVNIIEESSKSILPGPEFTVVPAPKILKVSPNSGSSGTKVLIYGFYFSPNLKENKVYIGDVQIPINSVKEDEISIIIPDNIKSGLLKVEVNGQVTIGPVFSNANLGVTKIVPENGIIGTEIELQGFGFSPIIQENQVLMNGIPAQILTAAENKLVIRVPAGYTTGPLQVQSGSVSINPGLQFKLAFVETLGKGELNLATSGGSIALDQSGNIYVLEINKHCIKKIAPNGVVSHFAGSKIGERGLRDGQGDYVLFDLDKNAGFKYNPTNNQLYLTESKNMALRTIKLDGSTSTRKSTVNPPGKFDFYINWVYKNGLILSNALNNSNYGLQVLVTPEKNPIRVFSFVKMSNLSADVRFAIDDLGDMFCPGLNFVFNHSVITKYFNNGAFTASFAGGVNTSFAGSPSKTGLQDGISSEALFNNIKAIAMCGKENLLVLDGGNNALRMVSRDIGEVSTIFKNDAGFADGDFRTAKISSTASDIVVSPDGRFCYILDNGNNCVRKVQLE
ncbi:IPT/TIG domain-containing protein [Sphingobacterium humi]|uniref:IPT/TIG domain-containing protein n=1 Tax=Sphingobacterium humi TaxID=1796905 RepID=A0A6N8L251_9SPHI|nr:IPT/TIG domain-containing protein [Sphingobacterium humi]MVZ62581.1 hypothetical protein [Sphingobacterium humi]